MANMRKDKRLTSSDTRQERIKGNAGGSQPRPRPTQVSTTKQQGPLRPKATTTSAQRNSNTGTAQVTSNNRAQSPRLPKLPKNPVRMPSNGARDVMTPRQRLNQLSTNPQGPNRSASRPRAAGAGRMGGPVAGTLLAAATPGVRRLGTAMGTKLGKALRPAGRAIDRAMGTKPKKKPKK